KHTFHNHSLHSFPTRRSSDLSVETLDLSEVMGRIQRLRDNEPPVVERLKAIRAYVSTNSIPENALVKMAKLGAVIHTWMKETERSEEHTSELQSRENLVCRLL